MANTIRFKQGSGSDPSASDLVLGEPAVRTDTGELFFKKDDGSVAKVSGGGGVDDGDKGDITVSSSGATWTIDNDAVTYAKIQNVSATNRILGRDSSGAGVIEEITPANLRTMLNVADGATNVTNTNQLTNGAGFITSADGGNAATLDGIDSSEFLRSNADDEASRRITFSNNATDNEDTIASSTGSQGGIEIYNSGSGNDAFMAFHSGGDYALYFGLDADTNSLAVGGWSMGANKYKIWHAGNDGSGSGLDADTLDGVQGSDYMGKTGSYWNINNWMQVSSNHGLYWPNNYSYHLYLSGQYLFLRNNQGANGLAISTDNGTIRGYIYANNGNEIGILDQGGNWSLKTYRSGNNCTLYDQHFYTDTDSTYDLGSNSTRWRAAYVDTYYGDGSNLTGISAGATGGGSDEVFWENGQTVTSNYTITNGKNAMSAGPIEISSGVTVTIGSGETWTVV